MSAFTATVPFSTVELDATAATIEETQHRSGMIPWYRGGHADPWNHVEAAMALSSAGRFAASERAYSWLAARQRDDGAWHAYYASDESIEEPRLDTNATAYVATGIWHHFLATGDRGFLEGTWPMLEQAVDWAVGYERPGGGVAWSVEHDGTPGGFALLAASSSVCTSLGAAIDCAEALGRERPTWELVLARLSEAVAERPFAFAPKSEYAMDWYYPVLCGAISGEAAELRLDRAWEGWVVEGEGVLCRSDRSWVTTAETAECSLSCARLGRYEAASELLSWTRTRRQPDGAYATGVVLPGGNEFPAGERTTYSAAAVILASDCLAGSGATSTIFATPADSPR